MKSHDIPWNPMISHEAPWSPMKPHEITWYHMISHEIPWNHMKSHEIPWSFRIFSNWEKISCIFTFFIFSFEVSSLLSMFSPFIFDIFCCFPFLLWTSLVFSLSSISVSPCLLWTSWVISLSSMFVYHFLLWCFFTILFMFPIFFFELLWCFFTTSISVSPFLLWKNNAFHHSLLS